MTYCVRQRAWLAIATLLLLEMLLPLHAVWALEGEYTIGGLFPDFENFSEAVESLESEGLSGPTVFIVRSGIYEDRISLENISGLSEQNPLSFLGEAADSSEVQILHDSGGDLSNATLYLAEIGNITFEHLSFVSTGNSGPVVLDSGAHHISFLNCSFSATEPADDSLVLCGTTDYYEPAIPNDHLLFQSCYFGPAFSAITLSGPAFSIDLAQYGSDNSIIACTFDQHFGQAIRPSSQQNLRILDNIFFLGTEGFGTYAIVGTGILNSEIIGNEIYGESNAYAFQLTALNFLNPQLFCLIANNMISVGGSYSNAVSIGGDNYLFAYNTIVSTSPNCEQTVFIGNGDDALVYNNIFYNAAEGLTMESKLDENEASNILDHNLYYTAGPELLIGDDDITYSDLESYQNANSWNANSLFGDPQFNSLTDLRTSSPLIDGAGFALGQISTDIDGDIRDPQMPDIGADEFGSIAQDEYDLRLAEVLSPQSMLCEAQGNIELSVLIENLSNIDCTNFEITFQLDGEAAITETVSEQIIPASGSLVYSFNSPLLLESYGSQNLNVTVASVNDPNQANNSLEIQLNNGQQPDELFLDSPTDGASVSFNFQALSWFASQDAIYYDLFVWESTDTKPDEPTFPQLTELETFYFIIAEEGTSFNWQVEAHNGGCISSSDIFSFTYAATTGQADLSASITEVPEQITSGTTLTFSYQVENIGQLNTSATTWYDMAYLSLDQSQDFEDRVLGGVSNFSALEPGQQYSQSLSLALAPEDYGQWYLILKTDAYQAVSENAEPNNVAVVPIEIAPLPPADLQPTSLLVPSIAFSNAEIEVEWTVANTGVGNTNVANWIDRVYISPSEVLDLEEATELVAVNHSGVVSTGESYDMSTIVSVPQAISGQQFLHIVVDANEQVFELVNEGNNTASADIEIVLSPPPDLVAYTAADFSSASNSEYIEISYGVLNQGGADIPENELWFDSLYVSDQAELSLGDHTFEKGLLNGGVLAIGDTIFNTTQVKMPDQSSAPQYIHIYTDKTDRIFEYTFEGNNVTSIGPITLLSPDLLVSQLTIEDTFSGGDSLDISYSFRNEGPGKLLGSFWDLQILLSLDAFPSGDDLVLGSKTHFDDLEVEQEQTGSLRIGFPNNLTGPYYVIALADGLEQVFEANQENNNHMSRAVSIAAGPALDLAIYSLLLDAESITAGYEYPISVSIINEGEQAIDSEWKIQFYISEYPEWTPEQALFVKQTHEFLELDVNESTSISLNVPTPMLSSLSPGLDNVDIYFYALLSPISDVFESTIENNITQSSGVFATCPVRPDLEVIEIFWDATTVESGEQLSIQWSVVNNGSNPTFWDYEYWYDGVFFSSDSLPDETDRFVTDWVFHAPLKMDSVYTFSAEFEVPYGIDGPQYLLLVSDHTDLLEDTDRSNNHKVFRNQDGGPILIDVNQLASADLALSETMPIEQLKIGQVIEYNYSIQNLGEASPNFELWKDALYLSSDGNLQGATLLGYREQQGPLVSGETYTGTINFEVPQVGEGSYQLIFKTDASNAVFETNESNNLSADLVEATLALPADLSVAQVMQAAEAFASDEITVSWTLKNEGVNPAEGLLREGLFLSTDQTWDEGDILLGVEETAIQLAPFSQRQQFAQVRVPGILPGQYFVLVKTNLLNTINESDSGNNLSFGEQAIEVSITSLLLEDQVSLELETGVPKYFQIEVPSAYQSETMVLELLGGPELAINELYLSYEAIPSRSQQDFYFEEPLSNDQQLTAPNLNIGTYYVMVFGESPESQALSLSSQIRFFEVTEINSGQGGNTGQVTVQMEGYRFDGVHQAFLINDSGEELQAVDLLLADQLSCFATFDLANAELGLYSMGLRKPSGEVAILEDSFEVVPGHDPLLLVNFIYPQEVRINRIVPISVQMINNGNTNIATPMRAVQSLGGAPLAYDSESALTSTQSTLTLSFAEADGPPEVLRPGAVATVTFYAFSSDGLNFKVLKTE